MVLAAKATVPETDVAATAARSFTRGGGTVVTTSFARVSDTAGVTATAVVAADVGVVECVLDDGDDPAALGPGIARLVAAGWEVTLLVPVARVGETHRALRRMAASLQPWWLDPDHGVCFGAPQVL